MTNPEVRLLTLTGPPGSGKTRLAIQVAHDASGKFGDGGRFIALETLHDSNLVAPTLVRALGIPESPAKSDEELLCAYLQGRSLLLVLDNFEQISDAADLVSAVLGAAPGLKILVTSRTPLHVSGEYEFDVPPLAVPEESEMVDLNALAHCPSVELFVSRAQAAKARFRLTEDNAHAIAQICVRLDGLPLTLELAAARIKVLEPRTLLSQLGHSLDLLTAGTRDRPERQKTLRQAIAWSYNLLDTGQQTLLRRLAVFEGGCTVDAVQPVCYSSGRNGDSDGEGDNGARVPVGPDARVSTILAGEVAQDAAVQTTSGAVLGELSSLVDQSLLRPHADPEGDPRFTMLVTVREYALEQLARSGEESHVRAAHARFFLALAERAETHLRAPDQQLWMRRLEADIDNLRAALACAVEQGDTQAGLRFLAALWWFWWLRGYGTEGRGWAERVLSRVEPDIQTVEYARALKAAGWLTYYQAGVGHEILAQSYHRKS
ncbi:MAG TPA: NB-ARC domain-containing protein, partial [Chloroflexia bacterium]|nr:NB-ARC domain-containing protein [Chloroflexia bacterium]